MIAEGAALNMPDGAASRRHLPYALLATATVVVLPALAMLPLAPLDGLLDVLLSAVLAIGLSVVLGSVGAALWSRRPESNDVVFGDLMLWRWVRRVVAERRMARTAAFLADDVVGIGTDEDPLLPALQRLAIELEARDSFMSGHSQRVARHARRIACQMGLDEEEVARIEAAASVHDVGKVFLPHSILAQPGPLTDEQYALVKRHAEQGAELVAELDDPELTAMVRHHHERVDGGGYPDGLAGEEIPLGARIISVADTFDAITSDRPYRRAASRRSALDIVSEEAGAQLDAAVVAAFLEYCSGKRGIAGAAVVATAPPRLAGWLAATPAGLGVSAAPIAQGVCAAGAIALAGVCVGGSPGASSTPDGGEAADARPAQVAVQDLHGGGPSPSSGVVPGRHRIDDGAGPGARRHTAGTPRVGGDDRSTAVRGGGGVPSAAGRRARRGRTRPGRRPVSRCRAPTCPTRR